MTDEEWLVVDNEGHQAHVGRPFPTEAAAREHLAWLLGERRDWLREAAEQETNGNAAQRRWEDEQGRTFRIFHRRTGPWIEVG